MSDRPDLPSSVLWTERAILSGDMLSLFVYGISFVVFLQAIYSLYRAPDRTSGGKQHWVLIIYACFIFSLGTLFIGMDMHSLQLMFIDHRAGPGGPVAYTSSQYSSAITVIPNACSVIAGWFADAFLLYRCLIIFQLKLYIVALPILIYIATIPMGILLLFQTSRPDATLWTKTSVQFGIPYFSLSISLNIIITLAISVRLLLFRRQIQKSLGTSGSLPYTSIAAMLIESSSLYAVSSLLFIIPYGLNSPASHIFLPLLIQIQILAPMLIILRVAYRRAWTSHTATGPLTTMKFEDQIPGNSGTQDSSTLA